MEGPVTAPGDRRAADDRPAPDRAAPGALQPDDLVRLMRESPFHRWLGVELVRALNGEVEVRLPYRAEFLGDESGTNVHGGVISTLADIAGCFAIISAVGHDVPTVDLRVDYLRMGRPGEPLTAVARTVKAGRTVGLADVEVRAPDGRVIAVARGTFATAAPRRAAFQAGGRHAGR
jgi:uncharacterized protein (TIGR00369 family)